MDYKYHLTVEDIYSDDLAGKKIRLSYLSFNSIRWGTTKRAKDPYDVAGHEADFD